MNSNNPSSSLRVLISGGLYAGGTETHVSLLCELLVGCGATVTLASAATNWHPRSLTHVKRLGVRLMVLPFGYGKFAWMGKAISVVSWQLLLRRDFDVVYCVGEGRMHNYAIRFLRLGGKSIYHEIVECPRPGSVSHGNAMIANCLIANSKQVEVDMIQHFPGVPIRTIPFLTGKSSVGPVTSRDRVSEEAVLNVGFFGRLVPHKRPLELIECWSAINQVNEENCVVLHIYGGAFENEYEYGEELRHLIAVKQLEQTVKIHGPYKNSDLDEILRKIDIVVLPSMYEGLPLVLVEAMKRGVPIVATNAGGIAELGEENPDVIVTSNTEWGEFADALKDMIVRIKNGQIDSHRLIEWTEKRYGFEKVSSLWMKAILDSNTFFI